MPFYRVGDMAIHIRMTNTQKHPAPLPCRARHVWPGDSRARACCAISVALCDAPVGDALCSMPLCPEHAASDGHGHDYCPAHAAGLAR